MDIVLSMASYEKRFKTLHLSLKSMLQQSIKPNRFFLYLDKNYASIPYQVLELQQYGLEICYAEKDLKSHNKYFYTMQRFPNDIVITVDDDAIYPPDLINKLLISYEKHPEAVSAGRVHEMCFDTDGSIMPYMFWNKEVPIYDTPSMTLFANGVGGVLYPPGCMDQRLFSINKIQQLCLYSDDIWLKAMQILKGTPVVAIHQSQQHPPIIENTQAVGLYMINKLQCRNDLYIKKVFNKYHITKEVILGNEYN